MILEDGSRYQLGASACTCKHMYTHMGSHNFEGIKRLGSTKNCMVPSKDKPPGEKFSQGKGPGISPPPHASEEEGCVTKERRKAQNRA